METENLILISDYLAGTLSPEEETMVENRLKSDPEFAAAMKQHREELVILQATDRAEMKKILQEQYEVIKKQKSITRNLWTFGAIAAAAAILLLVWFGPLTGTSAATEQLAMQYNEPFPLTIKRGKSEMQSQAFEYYKNENFAAALPLLDSIHKLSPDNAKLSMYLAESYSHTGDYRKAANMFKQLSMDSPFEDAAEWRFALNLLLAGEVKEARALLEEIHKGPHYRSDEAGELLKGM